MTSLKSSGLIASRRSICLRASSSTFTSSSPTTNYKALALAGALQEGGFRNGARAAIIMTNQSKWLISAYAVFFCGGVLVPLDYKLNANEQVQLLAHSKAEFLIVEFHLWRAMTQSPEFPKLAAEIVLVTEAPLGA